MGKPSRVEPEFVQRLRQRAARFSDLDLTLVEWASVENAVDSFTRRTMAAMRPGALELVRRTIFSAETNQLERDRSQLEASLTAEFRVAAALESEVVAATLEARTRAGRLLSDLNAELAATQSRLDDLE